MSSLTIVDYGMGNLRSVQKAIEKNGATAQITSDPAEIEAAERLILPGVGAFRDAIAALEQNHLVEPIKNFIASDRPFLGICLGLQLLLELSREDGEYAGLSVVPGEVVRFELPSEYKIPHMGWNQLQVTSDDNPLFQDIPADAWFYFVHSYYVLPSDSSWTAAMTNYHIDFTSAVRRGNTFATQFHPEKSQKAGLQLLRNFMNL